jgi:hypothetical protein
MNAISNCSCIDTGIPSPAIASLEVIDGQHRVVAVRWAAGKRVGRVDRVDLSPLIDAYRFYAPLRKDAGLFGTAHLIDDGYAIAWGDGDIDMSATSVERLAEEAMTGADFRAFLNRYSLTHQAAASALGRSKRQIEHYLQDETIPRTVVMACFGYEARHSGGGTEILSSWNRFANNLCVGYSNTYGNMSFNIPMSGTYGNQFFNQSMTIVTTNAPTVSQPKNRARKARA